MYGTRCTWDSSRAGRVSGVVFGHANWAALTVASVAVVGVVLFVHLYEEPTLRKMFGADYEEYCRNVRRWLPRMHAWAK